MSTLFPTPATDQSVYVLWQIFGNIIYYITGSTPPDNADDASLIHSLLASFNSGLLSVILLIYGVILIIGTLNTAHQGEFLGRNWSSLWMPIRAIFGPLFVIPVKYGFCLAQIILLYGVIAGVSFADYVWSSVNTSLDNTQIPAVPTSLLSQVKTSVGNAVLLESVEGVADSLGVGVGDLPKLPSGSCQDAKGDNQFYNDDGVATYCVSSSVPLTQSLMQQGLSQTGSICHPDDTENKQIYNNLAVIIPLFYSAPYDGMGATVKYPGTVENINSTNTLMDYCESAFSQSMIHISGTSTHFFPVDVNSGNNLHSYNLAYKTSIGSNSSTQMPTANITGSLQFNADSNVTKTAVAPQIKQDFQTMMSDLKANDLVAANTQMQSILSYANSAMLNAANQANTPADIANSTTDGNNNGSSGYSSCSTYLGADGKVTLSYLECLQLNGVASELPNGNDQNGKPYSGYINSWWIGGSGYLAIDAIMNNNLLSFNNWIRNTIATPNLQIRNALKITSHYCIHIVHTNP